MPDNRNESGPPRIAATMAERADRTGRRREDGEGTVPARWKCGTTPRLGRWLLAWSGLAVALGLSGAESAFPEGAKPAAAGGQVQDVLLATAAVSDGKVRQPIGLWKRRFGRHTVGTSRASGSAPVGPQGGAIPDLCFFVSPIGAGSSPTGNAWWAHYATDPLANLATAPTVSYSGNVCVESQDGDVWIVLARSDYPNVRLLGFRFAAEQRKARAGSAVGGVPTFEEETVTAGDWMSGASPDAVTERTLDQGHASGVSDVGLVAMQDGVLAHLGFSVRTRGPLFYRLAEGKSAWEEVTLNPVAR